jgi:septal ring factor EnvC (AmiA/AmiB activator)
LSDEINHIQREKREASNYEKTMRNLIQERDALKDELRMMKQSGMGFEDQSAAAEAFWMTPETPRLCDDVSVGSNPSPHEATRANGDDDTFMLSDTAIIVSSSPDFRGIQGSNPPVTDTFMLEEASTIHLSAEASEADTLIIDLETARKEKRNMFDACRSRFSGLNEPAMKTLLRQSSPPSDFFDKILEILENALCRASDAAEALEGVSQECSGLGFSGEGVDAVIADMRSHFRSARLELERAIPGETANVSLEDGKGTLCALVRRVESLAKDLGTERGYHHGSLGREKALRSQFDALLHRYEAAASKINSLEDSIASSAGDMLHTRIRMQDLEREGQEQAIGIDRLSTALDRYHDEVKGLEDLIDNLEKENRAAKEDYARQISKLKKQVAHERSKRLNTESSASQNHARISELENTVEQNRIRACDLMAQVDILEKEHHIAVEALEQRNRDLQNHEAETGTLNVRISDLSTSLDGAKSEVQRLRLVNTGLEEQLQQEVEAHNEVLDRWAVDQARSFAHMKETINAERRRAKVRAANWELRSDDLMSDATTMGCGSEPVTPVSMTRFVDVEFGRGKNRRRMDSGIGILTGEELLKDDDVSDLRRGLDSDIDLPATDLI